MLLAEAMDRAQTRGDGITRGHNREFDPESRESTT